MKIKELLKKLKALDNKHDPASMHIEADDLLLEFIGSKKIKEAFKNIEKWYS